MDYLEIARKLRQMILEKAATLDDEDAVEVPFAYPKWKSGEEYTTGDRIRYGELLYKVLQDHTSQNDWTPDVSPSLFAQILPGQEGSDDEIGEWVQPDSTNPYMIGDRVTHNGKTWISTVDYNVWEPGVYGWEEVEG